MEETYVQTHISEKDKTMTNNADIPFKQITLEWSKEAKGDHHQGPQKGFASRKPHKRNIQSQAHTEIQSTGHDSAHPFSPSSS